LSITIEINLSRVDYLDITMDLETGIFKPYRKPGDRPVYVSALSNHPPQVLKNIPVGIEQRMSDNSSNEQIFNDAAPVYQKDLGTVTSSPTTQDLHSKPNQERIGPEE
jgi:hypothetical protein